MITDKDILLSKIYQDNTVCYWLNNNLININIEGKKGKKRNDCIFAIELISKRVWVTKDLTDLSTDLLVSNFKLKNFSLLKLKGIPTLN